MKPEAAQFKAKTGTRHNYEAKKKIP